MEAMPDLSVTTRHALQEAVLTPRFYTTDFKAIDALDIDKNGLRDEFEWVKAEFQYDYNKNHFRRNEEFLANFDDMPARQLFVEFLERSCTAEFSGCVLYAEMVKHLKDPTMRQIFQLMSRDEGRHAGFLNRTMADLNVALDLSVLQKRKKYTYFQPKFIFYTVYLSEKIGYSRYIHIYRHLAKNTQNIIHPIFKWFEEWCNDEYRHGEFFSMLMRSQPDLLAKPANRRWIRFFLLAVYVTMYINDARRESFYKALGLDWRAYDQDVIRLCNDISTQAYPVTLPVDDPASSPIWTPWWPTTARPRLWRPAMTRLPRPRRRVCAPLSACVCSRSTAWSRGSLRPRRNGRASRASRTIRARIARYVSLPLTNRTLGRSIRCRPQMLRPYIPQLFTYHALRISHHGWEPRRRSAPGRRTGAPRARSSPDGGLPRRLDPA